MNLKILLLLLIGTFVISHKQSSTITEPAQQERFDIEKDLLLPQFDCKTDVDDLHSVAAFKTLVTYSDFSKINYHAVAGTYGMQKGLYVPANMLFELAFGNNWTDAHENRAAAIEKVKKLAKKTLRKGGDVWIAEAGQSDFSAKLIRAIQQELPQIDMARRIHIVQHSDWNEEVTTTEDLQFVKQTIDYIKIPDGNAVGNGTPGFRSPAFTNWAAKISDPKLRELWQLAVDLGNTYNGKEGRYLNKAISNGGLDFSDLSETCWILGLESVTDTAAFFEQYID